MPWRRLRNKRRKRRVSSAKGVSTRTENKVTKYRPSKVYSELKKLPTRTEKGGLASNKLLEGHSRSRRMG